MQAICSNAIRRAGRAPLAGLSLLGSAAFFAAACPVATPAAQATKTVTISLSDAGSALWEGDTPYDKGKYTMKYSWRGTFRFKVPVAALKSPKTAQFHVVVAGQIFGTWDGRAVGSRPIGAVTVPYNCHYTATNLASRVSAALGTGPRRGVLRIVLHPRTKGFFPDAGNGANADCETSEGRTGSAHWEPSWLFRDVFSDHGRMSRESAVFDVPSTLLPRGTVRTRFPHEVGKSTNPLRGSFVWNNRGTLTARAR